MKSKFFMILNLIFFLSFPSLMMSKDTKYEFIKSTKVAESVRSWHFNTREHNGYAVYQDKIAMIESSEFKPLTLPSGYLSTTFSRMNHYFVIMSLSENTKEPTDDRVCSIDVYSDNGALLYKIIKPHYFDEAYLVVSISDTDGGMVAGKSDIGMLWFYDTSGNLSNEIDLFDDDEYALERGLHIKTTADGSLLLVLADKRPSSPRDAEVETPSSEPTLFLFTHTGEKLWQRPLPELSSGIIEISPDGTAIIASCYSTDMKGAVYKNTSLLNKDGATIAGYRLLPRLVHFSGDSKYVILAEKRVAQCIDVTTAHKIWEYRIQKKQGLIADVKIAANCAYSCILTADNEFIHDEFIYTNPQLIILNRNGEKVQQMAIADSFYTPAMSISDDNLTIQLGLKNSYLVSENKGVER